MAQQELAFAVRSDETFNTFETPFVDYKSGFACTTSFFLGEPVMYQPKNRARPTLTHISHIGNGYFICGSSTSGRMIPHSMAQSVLHMKLTLNATSPSDRKGSERESTVHVVLLMMLEHALFLFRYALYMGRRRFNAKWTAIRSMLARGSYGGAGWKMKTPVFKECSASRRALV